MFTSMDTDIARQVAVALDKAREELRQIEDTYLGPIGDLAKDESLVEGVRGAVFDAAEIAIEIAEYIKNKIEDLEKIANGGWDVDIEDILTQIGSAAGGVFSIPNSDLPTSIIEEGPTSTPAGGGSSTTADIDQPVPVNVNPEARISVEGHPELWQFPRLQELFNSGEVDPEKYAEILDYIKKNPEFEAEWFLAEFQDALGGDPEKMKVLAAALWDRFERMDEQEVRTFWEKMMEPFPLGDQMLPLAVLIAAGGMPEVPYIISMSWGEFLPGPYPLATDPWSACAPMLRALGAPIDWDDPDKSFDDLVSNALLPLHAKDSGIAAILESFNVPEFNGPGRRNEGRNEIVQFLAESYPDEVVAWAGTQADWAQNFIDQVTVDMSDEEYEEFFGRFMLAAAQSTTAVTLEGLAQLDRAFHQTNREVTIDVGAAIEFALTSIPIIGDGVGMAASLLGIINGGEDVTGSRIYQGAVDTRNRNLALLTLGMNYDVLYGENPNNPAAPSHPASIINDYFSGREHPERPLSAADWHNFEVDAAAEKAWADKIEADTGDRPPTPLATAAGQLTTATEAMDTAYQPPEE